MPGVRFIQHRDKQILMIDVAHCDLRDLVVVVKATKKLISEEAPLSVLALTDVTGIHFHGAILKVAKEFTSYNKPFIKASAIVGLDRPRLIEFLEILRFSKREFKFFDDLEKAKDWLVSQ